MSLDSQKYRARHYFRASEVSALLDRHCKYRRKKDEIITYIQRQHPRLKGYLPEGYQENTASRAIITDKLKSSVGTDAKMNESDILELAKKVPVVNYYTGPAVVEKKKKKPAKDLPKILQDLQDSPPKRKKRKLDMQLGAVRCAIGITREKQAMLKYCKQREESIGDEDVPVRGTFTTSVNKIPYVISGRLDFMDSNENVIEVKNRAHCWMLPQYDLDQCAIYSILTGKDTKLVQQNTKLGKDHQVMIADLAHDWLKTRWETVLKPGLDTLVESLEECYSKIILEAK